ncbi:MAG: hypothetical protein V3S14_15405 [Anaerolineae bacterium]
MRLILDANEYIFGLDLDNGQEALIRLLEVVGDLLQEPAKRIPRFDLVNCPYTDRSGSAGCCMRNRYAER